MSETVHSIDVATNKGRPEASGEVHVCEEVKRELPEL